MNLMITESFFANCLMPSTKSPPNKPLKKYKKSSSCL